MKTSLFALLHPQHPPRKMYSATFLKAAFGALALVACNPYDSRVGQYNAGPVDPINFPPENLGVDRATSFGARYNAGTGTFTGISAFISATEKVDYFRFAVPAPVPRPMTFNAFAIPATAPKAYIFDPQADNPFVQSACRAPNNYKYDNRGDGVRLDEQGSIFTALPTANYDPSAAPAASATQVPITLLGGTRAFGPIVNTVPVDTDNMACQITKSEIDLLARNDVKLTYGDPNPANGRRTSVASGRFAAAVIIDPGSAVYDSLFDADDDMSGSKTPQGLGRQRWGWFNQFLLAYIEGGYIPTEMVMGREQFKPMRIFVPSKVLTQNPMTKMLEPTDGAAGRGYDVVEFKRGQPGYSPLCQLVNYTTTAPVEPAMLPKSAADIVSMFGSTLKNGEPFYCLQTQEARP